MQSNFSSLRYSSNVLDPMLTSDFTKFIPAAAASQLVCLHLDWSNNTLSMANILGGNCHVMTDFGSPGICDFFHTLSTSA